MRFTHVEKVMEYNAQDIAAIWFMLVFGVCLIGPLFPKWWRN